MSKLFCLLCMPAESSKCKRNDPLKEAVETQCPEISAFTF